MNFVIVAVVCLVPWWIAIALLTKRDRARWPKERGTVVADHGPDEMDAKFEIPSWPGARDYLERPLLVILVPLLFLVHLAITVLFWPSFLCLQSPKSVR